jgi:hypothetical protein
MVEHPMLVKVGCYNKELYMAEHWNGGNGGKGCKPRPFSVSQEEYDNRFEAIFGKKKKSEEEKFDDEVVMKDEYYDLEK